MHICICMHASYNASVMCITYTSCVTWTWYIYAQAPWYSLDRDAHDANVVCIHVRTACMTQKIHIYVCITQSRNKLFYCLTLTPATICRQFVSTSFLLLRVLLLPPVHQPWTQIIKTYWADFGSSRIKALKIILRLFEMGPVYDQLRPIIDNNNKAGYSIEGIPLDWAPALVL